MSLTNKFKEEIKTATWDMLKVNYEQGALFIVDAKVDLVEVACALAEDGTGKVSDWLDSKLLYKAEKEKASIWKEDPHTDLGNFLIVQPYVLLQLS